MVLASGREAEGRRELCQVGTAGAVKALRVVERGRRRVQNPHPPPKGRFCLLLPGYRREVGEEPFPEKHW